MCQWRRYFIMFLFGQYGKQEQLVRSRTSHIIYLSICLRVYEDGRPFLNLFKRPCHVIGFGSLFYSHILKKLFPLQRLGQCSRALRTYHIIGPVLRCPISFLNKLVRRCFY